MRTACKILLVGCLLCLQSAHVESNGTTANDGGSQDNKVISQETYNQVLDIVFPRNGPRGDYGVVLRFKPSSGAESQIVINRGLEKTEVVEYVSASGNIYSKLNALKLKNGNENVEELARSIEVRKRSISASPGQVKQWHADFVESLRESLLAFQKRSEAFAKTGSISVALDGTFYDVWYGQGINEMSLSLYDEEVSDQKVTGELKTVQWMNAVRLELAKLK